LKTDLLEKSDGFIIGINMSLLDVHVNRAPISGKALLVKHTPGNLISLKQGSSEIENVRNTIIIKNGKCSIGIIQIGSKLVSKIICYLKQNEHIERGGRIGKITFGSQVDVIFRKEDVEVLLVTEGTLVYAGLTPIARLKANQVDKESDLT
jgi:phosphatidylserine decarboxylase